MTKDKLYNKEIGQSVSGGCTTVITSGGTVIGIFANSQRWRCDVLIFRDPPTFGGSAPLAMAQ
jgi:hypothetical protein